MMKFLPNNSNNNSISYKTWRNSWKKLHEMLNENLHKNLHEMCTKNSWKVEEKVVWQVAWNNVFQKHVPTISWCKMYTLDNLSKVLWKNKMFFEKNKEKYKSLKQVQ